jgi:hypothetical protein
MLLYNPDFTKLQLDKSMPSCNSCNLGTLRLHEKAGYMLEIGFLQ